MLFYQLVKRLTIDILTFLALLVNVIFLYTQMIPYVSAAFKLHVLNGHTIPYILYAVLLTILPCILLIHGVNMNKGQVLRVIFYCFSITILAGTVSDLISYHAFTDYIYSEGDAVFINTFLNIPNMLGAVFGIILAFLYFMLGKWIKRRRRIAYVLYLLIFLITTIAPFIYTYSATGFLPRETWLEKAIFIIPENLLILVALTISATSRELWKQHIWNY